MRIVIGKSDLRRDTFCAGGPGGQRQNKSETAVRYTHLPTGLSAESRIHEKQGKNNDEAMRLLLKKLRDHYMEERMREAKASYDSKDDASFGRQIRSYYLCGQRRVIDHRSGAEHPRPEDVLDGELDRFLAMKL
jgi:peptide chain release factor 2